MQNQLSGGGGGSRDCTGKGWGLPTGTLPALSSWAGDTTSNFPSVYGKAKQPDRNPGYFLGLNLDGEQMASAG